MKTNTETKREIRKLIGQHKKLEKQLLKIEQRIMILDARIIARSAEKSSTQQKRK